MPILVVDTETNGVEPWRHVLWEVGAVTVSDDRAEDPRLRSWTMSLGDELARSSPDALRVNDYHERTLGQRTDTPGVVAATLAKQASGCVLASCNVSFDKSFIEAFLLANGQVPTWGYSPIDIKSLCYGRRRSLLGAGTSRLLKEFGVDVDRCLAYFEVAGGRHGALADAVLATALLYEAMGWGIVYGGPQCAARWGSYRCALPWRHDEELHCDRVDQGDAMATRWGHETGTADPHA